MELGYHLSSEEHGPTALVDHAKRAEEAGFSFALISDHFHPWIDAQGEAPFVWNVIGAIAHATSRIRLGTGVTCPLVRIHPAIVAQAAATSAAMMDGRFFLGVGTGEALNEHVVGERWPADDERLHMLEEAIEVIRALFTGEQVTHRGPSYTVEDARLYTLPDTPPDIYVAAMGPMALSVAGRAGDGLITIVPKDDAVEQFRENGGDGKPAYVKITGCWAESDGEARRTALERFGNAGVGAPMTDIRTPSDFESIISGLTDDTILASIVTGPDPDEWLERIRSASDAGFDHIYLHQVGDDQEGFFRFAEKELLPRL